MATIDGHSDEQLMGLLCEGREEALAELVKRYQNDLFRFCLHYVRNTETALEKAQETYLRIYSARARFDQDRAFKPWMLCIARNLCLNELKRRKMVQMESLEAYASSSRESSGELAPESSDGPSEWLLADERRQMIMDVLAELPSEAREIIVMRYFEQMSARDIADIVETTEGAVRTRLHRALNQLRDLCEARKDQF